MYFYSRIKNWRICRHGLTWAFRRINVIGVLLLLLLPLIYSHIPDGSIDGNEYDYQNEGIGVIRSFRFHDFEPRSLSEHTWTVLARDHAAGQESKIMDNEKSDRKEEKSTPGKRKVRGIHFEADGKDLSVNLEFIIPFLRVPVARSVELTQTAFRKLADLNVNAILLGGGFLIAAALIVALVKTMSVPAFYDYGYKKATRAANFMDDIDFVNAAPGQDEFVTATKPVTLEQRLYANNINVTACAQRAICSYVQRTKKFIQTGKGSPAERIIDGLANLDAVKVYLNGTAVMDAIESGRKNDASTCENIYRSCKWTNMQNKALKITMDYFRSNFLKFQ